MSRVFRLAVFFALGLFLGGYSVWSMAAFANASGAFKAGGGGAGTWTGAGTVAGGAAQTIETVNVGGKYIGVPAAGALGAAALEAIITGLRASPQSMASAIAIGWLAQKGIQYCQDKGWCKAGTETTPTNTVQNSGQFESVAATQTDTTVSGFSLNNLFYSGTNVQACQKFGGGAYHIASNGYCQNINYPSYQWYPYSARSCAGDGVAPGGTNCIHYSCPDSTYTLNMGTPPYCVRPLCTGTAVRDATGQCIDHTCPTAYHLAADGMCTPDAMQPVGQSDWDAVMGVQAPDAVMDDLCKRLASLGSGCKVDAITGQPVTAPLEDYHTDPITGKQVRQVATVAPAPTPDNPTRVSITTSQQEKTTTTTTDPTTGQQTTTETTQNKPDTPDFCVLHPDSIVCQSTDVPDGPTIDNQNKNFAITPDGGWGADSGTCPADKVYALRLGGSVAVSWQPACSFATGLRPVVIGMAWVAAVLIAIGITKRYG